MISSASRAVPFILSVRSQGTNGFPPWKSHSTNLRCKIFNAAASLKAKQQAADALPPRSVVVRHGAHIRLRMSGVSVTFW